MLNNVQDLRIKTSAMLDKLETEWSEFNTELPPSIVEAQHTVNSIQVLYNYSGFVVFSCLSY